MEVTLHVVGGQNAGGRIIVKPGEALAFRLEDLDESLRGSIRDALTQVVDYVVPEVRPDGTDGQRVARGPAHSHPVALMDTASLVGVAVGGTVYATASAGD